MEHLEGMLNNALEKGDEAQLRVIGNFEFLPKSSRGQEGKAQ